MGERITSHGIEFIRFGSCQQCGICGCDKWPCPHHSIRDGKHQCSIYNRREEHCDECGADHAGCIRFPDNPWVRMVRSGECGFRFVRADGGLMDELPFLDGQLYLTK